jgi:hypothetical protein
VSKKHSFYEIMKGEGLSPYMRELSAYLGQQECYESAKDLLNKLLRTNINTTAIFRQTNKLAEQVADKVLDVVPGKPVKASERVYAQVDGSMLFTREDNWREVKVGRIFHEHAVHETSPARGWLKDSQYAAHLGGHEAFEEKMSRLVDPYADLGDRLVFVCDGARWIRHWIEAEYPDAMQILDFYHAMEHLGEFAELIIKDELQRSYWIEQGRMILKEKGGQQLIDYVKAVEAKSKRAQKEKAKLIAYYEKNAFRMNYPEYLEKDLIIGSGAIEATHRTLVQKRLKLSGQRWSIEGAQRLLSLRVLNMNGRWDEVTDYFRRAA